MRPLFRNFRADGNEIELTELARARLREQMDIKDVARDAIDFANSALLLFRGFYPAESLNFFWGQAAALPWGADYRIVAPDGSVAFRSIEIELRRARRKVASFIVPDPPEADANNIGLLYKENEFRSTIEGLTVAALVYFDQFLTCLFKGRLLLAIQWQKVALHHVIEAALRALRALRDEDFNALKSADVAESESRPPTLH